MGAESKFFFNERVAPRKIVAMLENCEIATKFN